MQKKITSYKKSSRVTGKKGRYSTSKDITEFRVVKEGSAEEARMGNLAKDSCCAVRIR